MTTSPQLVIYWIEFAFAGAVVLGVTTAIVRRLRQPIDRVNLIFMSILASVIVPLLLSSLGSPSLRLGWFTIDGSTQGQGVESRDHMSQPPPPSGTADVLAFQTEEQATTSASPTSPPKPHASSTPSSAAAFWNV